MTPQKRPSQSAFTLLELLVTMAILALVMAFSMPSLASGLRSHALTSGTRTTANYLRLVRATAIARGARARLVVPDGTTLTTEIFETGAWQRVGRGATLDGGARVVLVVPDAGVVFEPEGTVSAPATVTLSNTGGDHRQISVALLGTIEVGS